MFNSRKPAVAGLFYPGDKTQLHKEVTELLAYSDPMMEVNNLYGIIAPHAGYIYSGKTAAYAYNLLKKKPIKNVVLLSPSHREYFKGTCVYGGNSYTTPLGEISISNDLRNLLCKKSKTIFPGQKGHGAEHAVEVHLPFLQEVLGEFSLLPVVLGDQSLTYLDELVEKLLLLPEEETVIVASSDLSHFFPQVIANNKDAKVERCINEFDFDELYQLLSEQECEACGGGAIYVLLKAAAIKGYTKSEVIYRNDSSDASGDISEVVGYLSAVVYGK